MDDDAQTWRPVEGKLACQPVEGKLASQPVETKLASQPVETKLASQPVETKLASQPVESKLASQPVESNLASQPVESNHASQPVESNHASQPMESERTRNLKAFFKAHEAIPAANSTIIRGREGLEIPPKTKPEDEIVNLMVGLSVGAVATNEQQARLVRETTWELVGEGLNKQIFRTHELAHNMLDEIACV